MPEDAITSCAIDKQQLSMSRQLKRNLKKRMTLFVAERYDKKKTRDGAGVHFLIVYLLHFKPRAPVLLVHILCTIHIVCSYSQALFRCGRVKNQ